MQTYKVVVTYEGYLPDTFGVLADSVEDANAFVFNEYLNSVLQDNIINMTATPVAEQFCDSTDDHLYV